MQAIFSSERWHFDEPDAYWTIQYEYRRNGADMQYRFYWKAWVRWSTSWYDYGLQLRLFLDGVRHDVTVKGYVANNYGWSYEGTTDWYTVENKTTGTTAFYASMYDTSRDTTQATSSTYSLIVSPCGATITAFPPEFKSNENPPTIQYSNPAGDQVTTLEICIADDRAWNAYVGYRPLEKTREFYTFTAADMEALKALSGKSLNLTFVIRTLIGGVTLASTKPSTFTMVEDETTKPTVTLTVKRNNGTLPSKFADLWIQGKSRADVSITAQGKYNASINNSSFVTQIGRTAYNSNGFTSNVIDEVGNVDIIATVKDSREFTGMDKETISVTPYSKPLVVPIGSENAILCYRGDGDGNRIANSKEIYVKAKMSYHSVNSLNRCALQWRRKLSTEVWDDNSEEHKWKDLISKDTTNTDEYIALLPGTGDPSDTYFDEKESYTIQIRAWDDIKEYDIKTFDIPTEDVALHLGKGGKNVSIGTYCDYTKPHTFYSAWEAIFDKGINGTIIQRSVTDMLAFAEGCAQGFTPFFTTGDTTNVPAGGDYLYASGYVCKRSDAQITVVIFSCYSGDLAINTYYDTAGGWLGWKYIHTTTT